MLGSHCLLTLPREQNYSLHPPAITLTFQLIRILCILTFQLSLNPVVLKFLIRLCCVISCQFDDTFICVKDTDIQVFSCISRFTYCSSFMEGKAYSQSVWVTLSKHLHCTEQQNFNLTVVRWLWSWLKNVLWFQICMRHL